MTITAITRKTCMKLPIANVAIKPKNPNIQTTIHITATSQRILLIIIYAFKLIGPPHMT